MGLSLDNLGFPLGHQPLGDLHIEYRLPRVNMENLPDKDTCNAWRIRYSLVVLQSIDVLGLQLYTKKLYIT